VKGDFNEKTAKISNYALYLQDSLRKFAAESENLSSDFQIWFN
jgi:hypothetical protein